jgi:hypothetical protein
VASCKSDLKTLNLAISFFDRGALHKDKLRIIYEGNMKVLYELRLRCHGCGLTGAGRDYWEMCTPYNAAEVDRFVRVTTSGRWLNYRASKAANVGEKSLEGTRAIWER